MYNRPHIRVVQHVVKRVILRLMGIALPAARLATIVKNLAIGPLFAMLRRNLKVAAQCRAPIGPLIPKLKEPSGHFLWAPVL